MTQPQRSNNGVVFLRVPQPRWKRVVAATGLLVCVTLFVSLFAGWEDWWGWLWLAFWGLILLEAALGLVNRRRQRRRRI